MQTYLSPELPVTLLKAIETGFILSKDVFAGCNFCEIKKKFLIWAHPKDFFQFAKPFNEFELQSGAAQW